jgi:hypothetical protein
VDAAQLVQTCDLPELRQFVYKLLLLADQDNEGGTTSLADATFLFNTVGGTRHLEEQAPHLDFRAEHDGRGLPGFTILVGLMWHTYFKIWLKGDREPFDSHLMPGEVLVLGPETAYAGGGYKQFNLQLVVHFETDKWKREVQWVHSEEVAADVCLR